MASDGLFFSQFARVSNKSRTPIFATVFGGILAALMALLFDLLTLIEMLSIGTLIAYTQVALAVIISRYETNDESHSDLNSTLLTIVFIIVGLCSISIYFFEQQDYVDRFLLLIFVLLLCFLIYTVYQKLHRRMPNQPDQSAQLFLTPCLPWLPVFSIFCNVYLMLKLSSITWIRFAIWMSIGMCIYIFYGIAQVQSILFPTFI
jgi:amino acid transporter